ncbi:MAG: hypothetical protein WD717_06745 [Nitrosarchaeum sp.]
MHLKIIVSIIGVICAITIPSSALAQENTIPDWVKGIAGWWAEDKIPENEFINAMDFLITQEIIKPSIVIDLQNHVSKLQVKLDSAQKKISSLEQQLLELGTIPSDVDVSEPDLNTEKELALAWATGQITDTEYITAMQKLIDEGKIPSFDGIQGEYNPDQPIPSWIKNNAGWWAEGGLTDEDHLQGLQYLFKEGVFRNPLN